MADNVRAGLEFMGAAIPAVSALPGVPHGGKAAARLEAALRKCLSGVMEGKTGVEMALRVLCLMVRRGLWEHAALLPPAITRLYRQKAGIASVTIEEAGDFFSGDDDKAAFFVKLEGIVKAKTGARAVEIECRVNPALIGGCRVYLSGDRYDFSLAGELRELEGVMGR
jgi:F0F1-type ATP synthase delta subunit